MPVYCFIEEWQYNQQPRTLASESLEPNLPACNYVILGNPPLNFSIYKIRIIQKRKRKIILSIWTRGNLIGYEDEGRDKKPSRVTEQLKY